MATSSPLEAGSPLLEARRSRRRGTRHSGPLARACVPYYQHTGKDLDDKAVAAAGGRSRCGGTRHSGPLTRACVPYYQRTGNDPEWGERSFQRPRRSAAA